MLRDSHEQSTHSASQEAVHQHMAAGCRNHILSQMWQSPAVLRRSRRPGRLHINRLVCTAALVLICCHSRCSSYARQPAPAAMLLHRMLAQVGCSSAKLALPYCSVMHRGHLSACASTSIQAKPCLTLLERVYIPWGSTAAAVNNCHKICSHDQLQGQMWTPFSWPAATT